MTLDALREAGADVSDADLDARVAAIGLDDVATIVYTSGTTGPPKGCMLTHGNLRADIEGVKPRVGFAAGDDVVYVFLPLAHVLTRIVQLVAVDAGAEMAYWRRDPKKIVEDVQLIKPTHLPSVPRIFEKIHAAATAKADAAGGAKAKIFHWAVGVGREVARREDRGGHPGLVLKAQARARRQARPAQDPRPLRRAHEARADRARRRSTRRSSSSSTLRASGCSRATG